MHRVGQRFDRPPDARAVVTDDDDRVGAAGGAGMFERMPDERDAADRHQRFRDITACARES